MQNGDDVRFCSLLWRLMLIKSTLLKTNLFRSSINTISPNINTELNTFINNMIGLINTINPFIDCLTQIAYEIGALITEQDLIELEQNLKNLIK